MNISKLEISGYKNLNIRLEHEAKVISLIGNNGSGKSNLLEALSQIFKNLYSSQKTSFDYQIEYTIDNNSKVKIVNKNASSTYFVNGQSASSISDYLPKKVVAIYSGEANRLWEDSYKDSYDKFLTNIRNNTLIDMPKMLLINKYYWHLSLLTLLLSEGDDDKDFIKNVLSIDKVDAIDIVVNRSKYKHYKDNSVLELAKALEHKTSYTLDELKGILIPRWTTSEIYTYLYLLFTPKSTKIIEDITVKFNDNLTIDSLSEGEKKLLLLKSAFEFAIQEDSLFLLDEPDAHIHINNKEQIIKLIEPFKVNRQVILTTHSPTVTKSISNDELFMMDNGELIDKQEQEILDHLTGDFWNRHQQSSFLSSDKKVILLVEGRHDKTHLNNAFAKLKDEFDGLNFGIFHMDGATNIEHMIKGLYTCDIEHDRIYIGIVDADDEGEAVCKELGKTTRNLDKFHIFKYPKKDIQGFSGSLTVENLYDISKYESAYKRATNEFQFNPRSINSISENIKSCAKAILETDSANFTKEDFVNFRSIFQKIQDTVDSVTPTSESNINQNISTANTDDTTNESEPGHLETSELVEVFYKGAIGLYNPDNQHLTLQSGSQIRKDYIPSFSDREIAARESLKSEIGFEEDGCIIKTLNDYEFDSPSGAGKFVFCSNVNGREVWKNADGRSLKELYP